MRAPITLKGAQRLREELDYLKSVKRPEIITAIAEAREHGDLKENAEYHGARESQGLLQARINELKVKLSRAAIIDPSTMPQGEIRFGARIKVQKTGAKKPEEYTLVGAGEEDYDEGKILVTSPLAQGFLGKKKGDLVKIQVPNRLLEFTVLEVSYE